MNCPECNHQNPDDAAICEKCYLNFSLVRTSKLAIASMILGLSSLFFFVITGLPAIVLGIISIIKINKSKGLLTGKGLARGGINSSLVLMLVFFLVWKADAPPIPNDYTMTDLRSAPAECDESYHLLVQLTNRNNNLLEQALDSNNHDIGLSKDDSKFIKEFNDNIYDNMLDGKPEESQNEDAEKIKLLWKKTEKAREIIREINKFPEVADLSGQEQAHGSISIFPLQNLAFLYMDYTYLQNTPEEIDAITNELIEMDSVFRKLSINARNYFVKVCCYVCMANNISTANIIANKYETPENSIRKLAKHFTSFTTEELSLKNVILSDYLARKSHILKVYDHSKLAKTPLLKKNSILRWFRNFYIRYLNLSTEMNDNRNTILNVWPTFYIFKDIAYKNSDSFYSPSIIPFHYKIYNPIGSSWANEMVVPYTNPDHNIPYMKVENELLKCILSKRLGEQAEANSLADRRKYIFDIEKERIYTVMPDGEEYELPINPEVFDLVISR